MKAVIYPKDIMRITGKSERHSRDLLKKIKVHLGKEKHQYVSLQDFCKYMGLKIEEVSLLIK